MGLTMKCRDCGKRLTGNEQRTLGILCHRCVDAGATTIHKESTT